MKIVKSICAVTAIVALYFTASTDVGAFFTGGLEVDAISIPAGSLPLSFTAGFVGAGVGPGGSANYTVTSNTHYSFTDNGLGDIGSCTVAGVSVPRGVKTDVPLPTGDTVSVLYDRWAGSQGQIKIRGGINR